MKIIGREKINKFKSKHANSRACLDDFVDKVQHTQWQNYADMKETFNSVDNLGNDLYCFNIGGNNFRLEAKVKITKGIMRIIDVMTHAEYDKKNKRR